MIRPSPNPVYDIHNPLGLHLLTRLRLGLSHLNEHKFNHNFKTVLTHFLLAAQKQSLHHIFSSSVFIIKNIRSSFLNELKFLDGNILNLPDTTLPNLILYGGSQFNIKQNNFILNADIKHISESNSFNGFLFQFIQNFFFQNF